MVIFYFLPAILLLGAITSYEDSVFGKIRNKWVLGAIIFGLSMNAILFALQEETSGEFSGLLIGLAISIAFSFVLWLLNFWSAGDGKLFIGYASLVPATHYFSPLIKIFPAFDLFVSTMVIFFIYLAARKLISSPWKKTRPILNSALKEFPSLLISILAVSWIGRIIGERIFGLSSPLAFFAIYAASFFVIDLLLSRILSLFKIRKIRPVHCYIAIIVLRILIDAKGIINPEFLLLVAMTTLAYSFLLRAPYRIAYQESHAKKSISELEVGDVIARENKEDAGRGVWDFIKPSPEGISKEELAKIRRLHRAKKLKAGKVNVAETTAFAPAMFAGVVVVIIFGNIGNLIYLLFDIIRMGLGLI